MSMLEELQILGANVDEAVNRFMGNTSLYEKMLRKFPGVMQSSFVQPDFDFNDYADIIEKAHSIKGVTGNLSLTPLYEAYTKIVDLLRGSDPEQANIVLKEILPVQTQIIECIEKYM